MVISYAGDGTIYSLRPDAGDYDIELLKPELAKPRPGLTPILPVDVWQNQNDFVAAESAKKPFQFISPDGTTVIPAGQAFVTGKLYHGSKMGDELRALGMASAISGQRFYITDEEEQKTYAGQVEPDGTVSNLQLFAEMGGESVTADEQGNVYIAAGNVFVYNDSGRLIDTIRVPERPEQLLFGGTDRKTLFILARSSLYSVQCRFRGR
jgi:hypothetical protein